MPVSPSHTARIARFAPAELPVTNSVPGSAPIVRGVGPYPGDRVAHVGHLVGECHVRLQPVVRAHADETAPAGQVPDQRPRFAGLVAGVEAAAMEVQQDRRAGRPVAAVVHVQRAARPVAVGQAAHPDHVGPAREERGAQDAAPRPPRPAGVAQRRVRAQRAAHHDHQAGQREQRDSGAGGASLASRGRRRRARARSTRSADTPR